MFRNFYAEQKMTDPRDSWYKPNLLYNIHYKPPKQPALPKMMVVTKEFNPSVCSCGEHGCKPHYRMEREVVWSNKEVKNEERELKENVKSERDERKVVRANKEVKHEGDGELREKVKLERGEREVVWSDKEVGNKEDRKLKEMSLAIIKAEVKSFVKADEKRSKDDKAGVHDAGADNNDEEDYKDLVHVNAYANLKGDILDDFSRLDDVAQPDRPDNDVQYTSTEELSTRLAADTEDFGSAFGIMSVFCDSELHTAWNGDNGMVTE